MAKRRWRYPCRARRKGGEECAAWSVSGAHVCSSHGGLSPRVRRAANQRLVEARLRRVFDHDQRRWQEARVAWLTGRVVHVVDVLGRSPTSVVQEVAEHGWLALAIELGDWPAGLRLEDEPQRADFRDRRFGPRRVRQEAQP